MRSYPEIVRRMLEKTTISPIWKAHGPRNHIVTAAEERVYWGRDADVYCV
jgi:hypothetical protein